MLVTESSKFTSFTISNPGIQLTDTFEPRKSLQLSSATKECLYGNSKLLPVLSGSFEIIVVDDSCGVAIDSSKITWSELKVQAVIASKRLKKFIFLNISHFTNCLFVFRKFK